MDGPSIIKLIFYLYIVESARGTGFLKIDVSLLEGTELLKGGKKWQNTRTKWTCTTTEAN